MKLAALAARSVFLRHGAIRDRVCASARFAPLVRAMATEPGQSTPPGDHGSAIRGRVPDEARSRRVLRPGAIAPIHQLSDRAAFFRQIGPGTYAEWLKAIPQHASTSLYLHVPFCRSMCWYCGCNTSVVRRDDPIAVYASALRCEIELVSRQIDRRIKVEHIHFGGGTPTIMAPETFVDLMGSLRQSFFVPPRPRSPSRSTRARSPAR